MNCKLNINFLKEELMKRLLEIGTTVLIILASCQRGSNSVTLFSISGKNVGLGLDEFHFRFLTS